MAPRTAKPKPKPKNSRTTAAAKKAARARRTAARDGKGAFTGKKRAGLIGQSKNTSKTAPTDVELKAIRDSQAEAKRGIITDDKNTKIKVKVAETGSARRAADRRGATRDAISTVEKRNVARAGGDAAKQLAARREAAVYEAYIRGRESGLSQVEAKREAKAAGEAFDRAEATKAKKAAEPKPKAPRGGAIQPSASQARISKVLKEEEAKKNAGKGTAEKSPAKARTQAKPPAGETPKNAAGSQPASATASKTAQTKVNTLTSQIKDVEDKMKANRAALRGGAMTQAEFDAQKSKLTANKNELMKARTSIAKANGISITAAKAEEGSRPARNPKAKADAPAKKATAKEPAAKKSAAKKTSAKPVKTVVDKDAIRKIDSKTGDVIKEFKDGKITKSQLKSRLVPLAEQRARLLNGGRPVGSAVVPSSGVRTTAEAVGRRAATGRAVVPRTAGAVIPKANVAAVTKATGLTWGKAASRLGGFFGKGVFGKIMAAVTAVQAVDLVAGLVSDTGILEKGMPPPAGASGGMGLPTNFLTKDKAKPKVKTPTSNKPEYPNIPNKYTPTKPKAPVKDYKGYRVKRGDTMWDIAKDNGVTLEQLYKANPIIAKRTADGKVDIFANTLVKIPKK